MEEFCKFYADDSKNYFFRYFRKKSKSSRKSKKTYSLFIKVSEINEGNFLKSVTVDHLTFMAKQVDLEFLTTICLKHLMKKDVV